MAYPSKLSAQQVLTAATQLLEERGLAELTMRNLAQVLAVRPSSLYRYYASQEVLLRAIGDRAAYDLQEALQLGLQEGTRAAFWAAAHAYLRYAREHPQLYALLLVKGPSMTAQELQASAGKALWNTLLKVVGRVSGNPDDTTNAVALWVFLHGYAELERSGLFGESGPQGGLEAGLEALFHHMSA